MRLRLQAKHDYPGFVAKELVLQYRRWMHYPPYTVLANVLIQSERLEVDASGWAVQGWGSGLGRGGCRKRCG